MISFNDWKNQFAYVGPGTCKEQEGTMEEAMLVFFYDGVSPWINRIGYKWRREEDIVARKFVQLCYMIDTTSHMYDKDLRSPKPNHRDFQEDRETFDLFLDTIQLIDFLDAWKFRTEIVGTRFDHLIKEFCYTWIDVCSGKPGAFTQRIFEAEAEAEAEEEYANGPDITSRKKWDLY
ncbi:MAG: hypothetical protein EBU66_14005 [Bacteroidetes bacterium]|nr:hypothetical protein [bacterium]NBP65762.1 hypothetical protein [Bacteroidota bacterium]